LARHEFAIHEKFYRDKVIPVLDYQREKVKLLGREMPLKQLASSLIQNRSAQTAKHKEVLELDNAVAEQGYLSASPAIAAQWTRNLGTTTLRAARPGVWESLFRVALAGTAESARGAGANIGRTGWQPFSGVDKNLADQFGQTGRGPKGARQLRRVPLPRVRKDW
jgi:hypothetical protein